MENGERPPEAQILQNVPPLSHPAAAAVMEFTHVAPATTRSCDLEKGQRGGEDMIYSCV